MERVTTQEYTDEDSSIIRITTAEAQDNLAETVNRVASGEERVIVSQDGKDGVHIPKSTDGGNDDPFGIHPLSPHKYE